MQAVSGHVADAQPAAAFEGQDVEVVATHLGGGDHRRRQRQPGHPALLGQDAGLDARRQLDLVLQPRSLGALALRRLRHQALLQRRGLERGADLRGDGLADGGARRIHLQQAPAQGLALEAQRLHHERVAARRCDDRRQQLAGAEPHPAVDGRQSALAVPGDDQPCLVVAGRRVLRLVDDDGAAAHVQARQVGRQGAADRRSIQRRAHRRRPAPRAPATRLRSPGAGVPAYPRRGRRSGCARARRSTRPAPAVTSRRPDRG